MDKINILVVPSDNQGGVGFYRSTQPHIKLEEMFPNEFSVTINMTPIWEDLHYFDRFQLIHIHKGIYRNQQSFYKAMEYFKSKGIKTILDIDDYWKLHRHHPQYSFDRNGTMEKLMKANFMLFDAVTTTTPIFAKEISKYNKNVFVIPNSIDPTDDRFKTTKKPSDMLRIGFIMGSTHEYDMETMGNFVNKLPQEIKDKVQFVLCGYDTRGTMRILNRSTGEYTERPIRPEETVWARYEKQVTDNYSIVDPTYEKFLKMSIPNAQYPNADNEHYKRCWTKDMNHYYEHYGEIDVLLAPLEEVDFNNVKSQLKVIECCFSKTAFVGTNFGPYKLDIVNAIEKGGKINENGNGILIDTAKNHKDWTKTIKTLVNNPELVKQLQNNIYDSLHEKFDLNNVTKERSDVYKKVLNAL